MPEEISDKYLKAASFLSELKKIDALISSLEDDYNTTLMKAQPRGCSYDAIGSSGSHKNTSQVEDVAINLKKLSDQKNNLIKKYADHKTKIYRIFNKMQTHEYVYVLLMIYCKGMSVDEISDEMHYSRTWIYELRKKAIYEFAENMED